MERRISAVPMDFEWQSGKGPVDQRSPFHTFAVAQEHQKQQQQGKKRPFSIFGSPSKSQPPSLREPTSQMHFLFSDPTANTNSYTSTSNSIVADPLKRSSSPTRFHPSSNPNTNKPLPSLTASSYFRLNSNISNAASSFATPRKLEPDICSSGPEGASSPEGNGAVGGADSPVVGGKEQQKTNTMSGGGFFGGRMLRFGGGAEKEEEKGEDANDASGNTIAGDDIHNYDGGFEFEAKKGYMESPPRRSSFFGRLGFLGGSSGSPGHGDLPKGYSTKVEKKVSKRRAATRGPGTGVGPVVATRSDRHVEKRMVRRKATAAIAAAAPNVDVVEESSGEEADVSSMFFSLPQKGGRSIKNKQSSSRRARGDQKYLTKSSSSKPHKIRNYSNDSTSPTRKQSILTTIFTFIETHPNVPHILSFYAQLLFNLFLIFSFMSILWSFWSTIRADVDKKADEAVAEALAEMAVCAQNYRENRCEPETRVPAMESVCNGWERCMDRDPRMGVGGGGGKGGVGAGGRAVISARTFAEIFNGFVEPISYKAMIFTIIILSTSIIVSNATFAFFRNKALDSLATYSHNYYGGQQQQQQQHHQQQQQYALGGGRGGAGQSDQQEYLSLNAGRSQFQIPQQHIGGGGYGRGYGYENGDGRGYDYGNGNGNGRPQVSSMPSMSSPMKTPRR